MKWTQRDQRQGLQEKQRSGQEGDRACIVQTLQDKRKPCCDGAMPESNDEVDDAEPVRIILDPTILERPYLPPQRIKPQAYRVPGITVWLPIVLPLVIMLVVFWVVMLMAGGR